jgi:uncharacterized protein YbjT (DUF2867 family)
VATAVLVVGATGRTGRAVAWALHDRGVPVRVFLRRPDKAGTFSGTRVAISLGDLAAPGSVESALRGVAAVFLPCPLALDPPSLHAVALGAARGAGVPRIVGLHPPGRRPAAAAGEAHFGVAPCIQDLPRWIEGDRLRLPGGAAPVAWVDHRDVVEVAVAALLDPAVTDADLTGPEAVGGQDLAAKLAGATGRSFVLDEGGSEGGGAAVGRADGVPRILGRPARLLDAWLRDHRSVLLPA